jgi:AmmeMemoRadiSam system protein B
VRRLALLLLCAASCGAESAGSDSPGGGAGSDAAPRRDIAPSTDAGDTAPPPGPQDLEPRAWRHGGVFYPEDPGALDTAILDLLDTIAVAPSRARAALAAHAGLVHSGQVAAATFGRIALPQRIIILAPNHADRGEPVAVWTEGPWLIPGHSIGIEREATERLQAALPELVPDRAAFDNHPPEMMLPFLSRIRPDARIAVLSFRDDQHLDFRGFDLARIQAYGEAIAGVIRDLEADEGGEVLLLATSDLSHHQPVAEVEVADEVLLDLIAALDVEGLRAHVTRDGATICGEIPAAIMMVALRSLGHTSADHTMRGHNFHRTRDPDSVVGYPSVIAWRP